MNRVTVPTMSRARRGRLRQGFVICALIGLPFAMVSCGGGDGGGTNSNPPPPTGAVNQFAYVIHAANSEIQAYRLDGDGNLTSVATPLATGAFPHHVDVDPAGRFVYVSNHDSPFVSGFRINQDASLTPMNPAPGSPVTGSDPTENQPHSSVIDQTGQFLYVVAGLGASTLRAYRIDQTAGNLGALTFIPAQSFAVGTHAHNIAISPSNQFVYVASEGSSEVYAFRRDTSTGALTPAGKITGLQGDEAVTVDPQSRFVYAAYTNAVEVLQIGNDGSLTKILPTSTFPTNQSGPHSLALHPNGQFLYVANINSNTITVFRVNADGTLTEIQLPQPQTGIDPNYVVVHPNGRFLYTADARSNQLSRFTINADGTLTPAGTIQAGNGPNGIGTTKF